MTRRLRSPPLIMKSETASKRRDQIAQHFDLEKNVGLLTPIAAISSSSPRVITDGTTITAVSGAIQGTTTLTVTAPVLASIAVNAGAWHQREPGIWLASAVPYRKTGERMPASSESQKTVIRRTYHAHLRVGGEPRSQEIELAAKRSTHKKASQTQVKTWAWDVGAATPKPPPRVLTRRIWSTSVLSNTSWSI
jgi:hypothetical protein